MSADCFFSIGSTHQVCQDHAIADGDFVVLSDGCSGAKDSDWGARFLTRSAYNILKQTKPGYIDTFVNNVIKGAHSYVEKVELEEDCLAATFLCVFQQDKCITVCVVGDGYIILKDKEGDRLTIISHSYDTGAPWYPYYTLSEELTNRYLEYFGHGKLTVEKTVIENGKVTSQAVSYAIKAKEARIPSVYLFPAGTYDLVGISSDGLKSFIQQAKDPTSITNKSITEIQVIKDLFKFKTVEGQFVHR